jgi:histidinol-phosphate aminotransferase
VIDLSKNEARFAPPREVIDRVARKVSECVNLYPQAVCGEVLRKIGALFARPGEAATLTRGVDEAVDLVLDAYPDREAVVLRPEFAGFVERFTAARRRHRAIDCAPDWTFPGPRTEGLGDKDLFFVSSPHNPSGEDFDPAALRSIADCGCVVLLDRAYREFADAPNAHERAHPRMLRFYSFSKAYGLAGQRVGVLVGPEAILGAIRARQWFFHVDVFTLLLLDAAMSEDWMRQNVRRTAEARGDFIRSLQAGGFAARRSQANFVLLREPLAEALVECLLSSGIRVAPTAPLGLGGHVRITIGTSEELQSVLIALQRWKSREG